MISRFLAKRSRRERSRTMATAFTKCRAAPASGVGRRRSRRTSSVLSARRPASYWLSSAASRRRASPASTSSASSSSQAPPAGTMEAQLDADPLTDEGKAKQAIVESEARLRYLEALVTLRTLYRTFLRAQYWIKQPQPLLSSYPPLDEVKEEKKTQKKRKAKEEEGAESEVTSSLSSTDLDEEEELAFALDAVAEMALTSDQLSSQLKSLPVGFSAVFESLSEPLMKEKEGKERPEGNSDSAVVGMAGGGEDGGSVERKILSVGNNLLEDLASRLDEELESLPFGTKKEAWSAVRKLITNEEIDMWSSEDEDGVESEEATGEGGASIKRRSILQGKKAFRRVIKAEKAAEKLVQRVRASSKGMMIMQDGPDGEGSVINAGQAANYMKGVWIRLNGGGKTGLDTVPLPEQLPTPVKISQEAKKAFAMGKSSEIISISVERLDKELKEASKARETKLRNAGVLERARMNSGTGKDASGLKEAEENVNSLRLELALVTLQLEMRLVFEYLEKEALQIIDENGNFLPWRRGSSEELALLVAEYALLDGKTTSLIGRDLRMSAVGKDLIGELAADVPDLRMRLGITDNEVVYMSLDTRIKNLVLIAQDSVQKVKDGFIFMGTGSKLLVTDITTCGKLFWRALLGGTLQPREVETLRRTARDVFTFVPFIIILILPITPVGHVLVFSFIQQNFPALFPSQFTSSRQKSMRRYEDLKKQLDIVMEQEGLKWREEQFNRAVEAVEALTANVTSQREKDRILKESESLLEMKDKYMDASPPSKAGRE